jgi:hypothetical protein
LTWRRVRVGIQLPDGVQLPKLPEGMPDLSKLTDQLPSALTHLKVPELKLPEMKLPDSLPDMSALKDKLPGMPALPKMPELPQMPSMPSMPQIPSLPTPPSPPVAAAKPPPPWLQAEQDNASPSKPAEKPADVPAAIPAAAPAAPTPPSPPDAVSAQTAAEPAPEEEEPQNVPLEELQELLNSARRSPQEVTQSTEPAAPGAAQTAQHPTSEHEVERPVAPDAPAHVEQAVGAAVEVASCEGDEEQQAETVGKQGAAEGEEASETQETTPKMMEREDAGEVLRAVVLDGAVFDENGDVKVSLPVQLHSQQIGGLFDSIKHKGGGGLGYAETLEIVFAAMKQQVSATALSQCALPPLPFLSTRASAFNWAAWSLGPRRDG